jgi:hypothetical protein
MRVMAGIHISTVVSKETVKALPELGHLIGQRVEMDVTVPKVSEAEWAKIREWLKGSVLRDDDPFGPAVPPEDWEALA